MVEEQHTNCREQATFYEGLSLVPWILSQVSGIAKPGPTRTQGRAMYD